MNWPQQGDLPWPAPDLRTRWRSSNHHFPGGKSVLKHLQSRDDWNTKGPSAKGFTLIELLVVIIILGVLAGVAIFAVNGIDKDAKASSCTNERDTVLVAIETYKTRNDGALPPTATSLLDTNTTAKGNLSKIPQYWGVTNGVIGVKQGQNFTWDTTENECVFP